MKPQTEAMVVAAMHALNGAFSASKLGPQQLPTWVDVIESTVPNVTAPEMAAATRRVITKGTASGSFMPSMTDLLAELIGRIAKVQIRYMDIHGHIDIDRVPMGTLRLRVPPDTSPPAYVDDREAERLRNGQRVHGCALVEIEQYDDCDTPGRLLEGAP